MRRKAYVKAYMVGMIVGAVCCIAPLVYLMNFDRCMTQLILALPEFNADAYNPASLRLASGVTIIGAVVLMLSATMMALGGLKGLKTGAECSHSHGAPQETSDESAS